MLRRTFERIIDATFSLFPQRYLAYLESRLALSQGKGWGAGTIAEEISACSSLLAEKPRLLIDIGGNRGSYTKEFLSRFPGSEVHIFEPSSNNVKLLQDAFRSVVGVEVVEAALSDDFGSLPLYSDVPGSGLASLTRRRLSHFGIEMNETEEVAVMRFDHYWRGVSSPSTVIDCVKIDVEGHEMSVLKGFGDVLGLVKLVQFEFGGCNIDTRTYFQDFWYFFADRGFSLYRISPCGPVLMPNYKEIDEFFSATNFIALNNRCLQR